MVLAAPGTGVRVSDFTFSLPDEVVEQIAQRAAAIVAARLPAVPSASRYLTVEEAAAYIRAKPQRIYDLRSSRRLTRHHDGTRALVSRAELDEYLERC
jgi:excisionase family DNA binding protein